MPGRIAVAQMLALLAALAIVLPAEWQHWQDARQRHWSDWFIGVNVDTTPVLLLFLVWPYFWFVRRPFWTFDRRWWRSLQTWWAAGPLAETMPGSRNREISDVARPITDDSRQTTEVSRLRLQTWIAAVLIAVISLSVSSRVAALRLGDRDQYRFGDLPPAYHDEYSYLFQAETYLAGRLSFPSHPTAARLFDQMHVLNEGRFASR